MEKAEQDSTHVQEVGDPLYDLWAAVYMFESDLKRRIEDARKERSDAKVTALRDAMDAYKRIVQADDSELASRARQPTVTSSRAEGTYLNIIGALLALMLGKTPAGKAQSVFKDQAAIVAALLAHHSGKQGISQRTLDEKFAAANRSLAAD